jgi:uncharacterized protein (DUF2147 family)
MAVLYKCIRLLFLKNGFSSEEELTAYCALTHVRLFPNNKYSQNMQIVKLRPFFFVSIIFFLSSKDALAQTKEQREVIQQSMGTEDSLKANAEIEKYSIERKERIAKYLAKNPKEKRQFVKNGKTHVLYDVTRSGDPIYRTLKFVAKRNKRKSKKRFASSH